MPIDLNHLRTLCRDETIIATKHFTDRLNERNIEYDSVLSAVMNGDLIEEYPNAYPYPCTLLLNFVTDSKPLHVVTGTDGNYVWLITAYYPTLDKWESDYKTRKVVENQ